MSDGPLPFWVIVTEKNSIGKIVNEYKLSNTLTPNATFVNVLFSFLPSGLEISYSGTQIKGNSLMINGIIAKATIGSSAGKVIWKSARTSSFLRQLIVIPVLTYLYHDQHYTCILI